jgi:hypothetical protein
MRLTHVFVIVLLMSASVSSVAQSADSFKWVTGTWKLSTKRGVIVEKWEVKNDSTISGETVLTQSDGKTLPQEKMEIVFHAGGWWYVVTVVNQNQGKPASFKIVFMKGQEFIAENPNHDFPTRINYRRIGDQLFASIEGRQGQRINKINFDYTAEKSGE